MGPEKALTLRKTGQGGNVVLKNVFKEKKWKIPPSFCFSLALGLAKTNLAIFPLINFKIPL
jgi:hypothetical protein